jgi:hypothetical protein
MVDSNTKNRKINDFKKKLLLCKHRILLSSFTYLYIEKNDKLNIPKFVRILE